MAIHPVARAAVAATTILIVGCSSPFDQPPPFSDTSARMVPQPAGTRLASAFRDPDGAEKGPSPLDEHASPDDFVRFALYNSPQVEAEYQRWRAASERLPQVAALPDPRLNVGFFLDEVETRVGPQQARVSVQQTIPWPGKLQDRQDAASRAALAAWHRFEAVRLAVTERVVSTLHELAYLDAATSITRENLNLLGSLEEVIRARYRVGTGTHAELIRVQVELGQMEDRLAQLTAMRPAYVAELNAALNRDAAVPVPTLDALPGRVVTADPAALADLARQSNPRLLALDEQTEEQRVLTEVARKDGLPDLTVGLDYIVTNEAANPAIAESGDDPIMLSLGINLPLWRDKYDAGVRESIARRLAVSLDRADETNRIASAIHRAWFEHTDADRRVRLYEDTLIPKAEESLRASLAGFRAGDASFLDLLDTERSLLDFAVAAERARADRGKALARLNTLVGTTVATIPAPPGAPAEAHP